MISVFNPPKETWEKLLERPAHNSEMLTKVVKEVFDAVKQKGDNAIKIYSQKFDGVSLDNFQVSDAEISHAESVVSQELKDAILLAKKNIETFHYAQKTTVIRTSSNGVSCWQEKRPIQKVGLYIPGGTAPLFSTVLMLALPAKIANCREIILCSPPNSEERISPEILYAAKICGVSKIFKIGGIQAIAAMTLGTNTISKTYKIFGPGNQYVTAAKQFATTLGIAIDMPAGPSELLVVADKSANSKFIASDLLSQAEHGADSQVIFISTDKNLLGEVESEINIQIEFLPRKNIAKKAIENSKLIWVNTHETALDIINEYAPEHLIICTENTDFYVNHIENAGSVFIGNYTPESAGDYASGTNHTLPTNGYAKNYSGVNLDSFTKAITFQKITKEGLKHIGSAIEKMAESEQLVGHKNAVTYRLNDLKNE